MVFVHSSGNKAQTCLEEHHHIGSRCSCLMLPHNHRLTREHLSHQHYQDALHCSMTEVFIIITVSVIAIIVSIIAKLISPCVNMTAEHRGLDSELRPFVSSPTLKDLTLEPDLKPGKNHGCPVHLEKPREPRKVSRSPTYRTLA